jgi:hypothetical protein
MYHRHDERHAEHVGRPLAQDQRIAPGLAAVRAGDHRSARRFGHR